MYSYYPYQRQEVVRVNGQQGAQAYQMPPNSSAILIDMNNPIVYLCVTDGAGLKSINAYTITEYKPEETEEYKGLSERIARLEALLDEKPNAKPIEQQNTIDEFRKLVDRQS